MDIVQHINELLFNYDCVIVHGFGGFVANYQTAKIHPVQHTFSPPSKTILFNKDLRNNDGLLANHIVSHENISYDKALEEINAFASKSQQKINNGETIIFKGIGQLFSDSEGHIQFDQEAKANVLTDAYGMTTFVSPAIQRSYNRKHNQIRPNFADRQKSPSQKKIAPILLKIAASVAVVLILSVAGFNYFSPAVPGLNESNIFPTLDQFTNGNTNDVIDTPEKQDEMIKSDKEMTLEPSDSDLANTISTDEIIPNNSTAIITDEDFASDNGKVELAAAESHLNDDASSAEESFTETTPITTTAVITEAASPIDVQKPFQRKYHLIAGSFQNTKNATSLIESYKQIGYEPALIGPEANGFYRVSIVAYLRKSDALLELKKVREDHNPNIWLLRN